MVAWRAAGINYVRFSQIAAEVTRNCIKSVGGKGAPKKTVGGATLKITSWEAGKPVVKK